MVGSLGFAALLVVVGLIVMVALPAAGPIVGGILVIVGIALGVAGVAAGSRSSDARP